MPKLALAACVVLASLNGCASYTIVSAGSYVTTGKSIGDHGASAATGGDCNFLVHLWDGKYICEMTPVYNKNPL